MTGIIKRLLSNLRDEEYRYAYDEEFSNAQMATQIKAIREQRGFTQTKLAELADMKQSRISALEDVNYSAWSISTLRRIARALGVRLVFRFESWGSLLAEVASFNRTGLEKPAFEDDPAFKEAPLVEHVQTAVGAGRTINAQTMFMDTPKYADEKTLACDTVSMSSRSGHLMVLGDTTTFRAANN
jgi:transcriptional regulator with XRE-family HTH domain